MTASERQKKIVADSIFIVVGNLLSKLKGIIIIPFIVSSVGLSNYGIYAQILINISLIVPFCTFGLGNAFFRYTSKHDDNSIDKLSVEYWSVIAVTLALSMLGVIGVYFLSPLISVHILNGKEVDSLKFSSLFVMTASLYGVNSFYIQARRQFKLYSVYDIMFKLFPACAFVVGVVFKREVLVGLVSCWVAQCVLSIALSIIVIRKLGFSLPSIDIIRKFMRYSWALTFVAMEGGLLSKIDRYFIGYFLGPASIGIYHIIYQICSALDLFAMPIRKYYLAYLPKKWDSEKQDIVKQNIRQGLLYFALLSSWFLIMIALLIKPFLVMMKNESFLGESNISAIVLVTGLGIIFFTATRFYFQMAKLMEQNYIHLLALLAALVANVVLNVLLIPKFGIMGASVATFVSYLANLIMCWRLFDIKVTIQFTKKMARTIILGLLLYGLIWCADIDDYMALAVMVPGVSVLFVGMMIIGRAVDIEELRQMIRGRSR